MRSFRTGAVGSGYLVGEGRKRRVRGGGADVLASLAAAGHRPPTLRPSSGSRLPQCIRLYAYVAVRCRLDGPSFSAATYRELHARFSHAVITDDDHAVLSASSSKNVAYYHACIVVPQAALASNRKEIEN